MPPRMSAGSSAQPRHHHCVSPQAEFLHQHLQWSNAAAGSRKKQDMQPSNPTLILRVPFAKRVRQPRCTCASTGFRVLGYNLNPKTLYLRFHWSAAAAAVVAPAAACCALSSAAAARLSAAATAPRASSSALATAAAASAHACTRHQTKVSPSSASGGKGHAVRPRRCALRRCCCTPACPLQHGAGCRSVRALHQVCFSIC